MSFLKKINGYRRWLMMLLLTNLIIACSSSTEMAKNNEEPVQIMTKDEQLLFSHQGWQLAKIRNQNNELITLSSSQISRLFFKNDRVTGKAACNDYFGNYQLTATNLVIEQISSTMAMCPEEVMSQEFNFLAHLEKVTHYKIMNQTLQLFDKEHQLNLSFTVPKLTPLVDTEWQLLAVNTGNALVSNLATEIITAKFSDDKKIHGLAGCNIYSAVYETEQDTLTVSLAITTRKFCQSPKGVMETEANYISALGQSVRYQITADRLTLFDKNQRRLLTYKKK